MFELEMFSPRAENVAQEAHSKYINSLSPLSICAHVRRSRSQLSPCLDTREPEPGVT